MEQKIPLIEDVSAVLEEAETHLRALLEFTTRTKADVEAAGTDPKKWSELAERVRKDCCAAVPYARIHLGKYLLNLNARVSNVPLALVDVPPPEHG